MPEALVSTHCSIELTLRSIVGNDIQTITATGSCTNTLSPGDAFTLSTTLGSSITINLALAQSILNDFPNYEIIGFKRIIDSNLNEA